MDRYQELCEKISSGGINQDEMEELLILCGMDKWDYQEFLEYKYKDIKVYSKYEWDIKTLRDLREKKISQINGEK